jgi:UDP-N-acetylenolpyruvoylglucosamine reductase
METLTTINTSIKEGHQREETVASSSINDLLDAKSIMRKDTMPWIAVADTSNLMLILLKLLPTTPLAMNLQIGTQIRVH